MITYLEGDATQPQGDGNKIIAHICNDVGAWGAGFTRALDKRWPEVGETYRIWYENRDWMEFGLGRVSYDPIDRGVHIANMVAQRGVGTGVCRVDYVALQKCLQHLGGCALNSGASVHMPRIGCGLAGGTWDKVEPIIEQTLCAAGIDVFIYDLPGGKR